MNASISLEDFSSVPKTSFREISYKVAEPSKRYDPVEAEQLLFAQPLRWTVRNVQLFVPLGYFVVNVVMDLLMDREKEMRHRRAKELLGILSGLGPAIIKGGQVLSSRPDLLPNEYLVELAKLQDRVPAFANDEAYAQVEAELGRPFSEVFELVRPDPIAAASIGQVYKARLRLNGEMVAVKVQRPRCEEVIALDLYILRWYAGVVNVIFRAFKRDVDAQGIIDDFGELIYREIDYRAEAVNARRFAELYAQLPDVFVPKVYTEYTTSKVLTMEWVDGVSLVDAQGLARDGLEASALVDTLVQCSLRQVLENGFFHADPHLGNLAAMPDGKLCYFDFGMVSYVEPAQRYGLIEAIVHLVNRDFAALAELYVRLGFIPADVDSAPVIAALEKALPDVLDAPVNELNFKNVINRLGDVFYKFPFSLPPFYIAIIRCLGVLEGVAIQAQPEFRIIKDAYPYVASRLLTDPSEELQRALQQLLFKDQRLRWDMLEQLLEEAGSTDDYDVVLALDQMTQYLLSEQAEPVRDMLADELVDVVDYMGAETAAAVLELLRAQTPPSPEALQKLQERVLRGGAGDGAGDGGRIVAARAVARMLAALAGSPAALDGDRLSALLRRALRDAEAQRLVSDVAAQLAERAAARSVRALFGLPPPTFPHGGGPRL